MTISTPTARGRSDNANSLSGTNLERAGDYNQRVVLQAIRINNPITRAALARTTGLTAPTVANITKRLIQLGLVAEAGKLHGGRGQPATKLVIPPDAGFALGVNIDRDHITVVILDLLGQIRGRASHEGPLTPPQQAAGLVRVLVHDLLATSGVSIDRLVGVGVALPDALGHTDLPAHHPLGEWASVDVGALFSQALAAPLGRRPPIIVENDAAAAALGELQFGHGLSHSSFFYLLISAGLGGGLVVEGDYFRGASGRSGEIGFLPVESALTRARTLQDAVSLSALVAELGRQGIRIEAPEQLETLDGAGRAAVDAWLEMAAELLTAPLLTVSWLVNPAAILIGGRLPTPLVDALAERLDEKVRARGGPTLAVPAIRRAAMSADAPAVGAAIMPFLTQLLPSRANLLKIGD